MKIIRLPFNFKTYVYFHLSISSITIISLIIIIQFLILGKWNYLLIALIVFLIFGSLHWLFSTDKTQFDSKEDTTILLIKVAEIPILKHFYLKYSTHSKLLSCKICGTIAVFDNQCLVCISDVYNAEKHDKFKHEIDYLKEEQLDLFGTMDKNEKVDFFEQKTFFKRNLNWKPLVTEAEVIAYSKEWNWD